MKISKLKTNILLGTTMAVSIVLPQIVTAQNIVGARTTIITACGKLFSIDSNADNLTPEQRAQIVQKNLDNALIAAKHRTPDAVRVSMMNRNPIVTLDGFYIVTADGNSAARNRMTQLELAHKWADSIRFCLADAKSIENYIAMLTGRYPKSKVVAEAATSTDVAVLPWGTLLPLKMTSPLAADSMILGAPITAELTSDVPLGPHFNSYLPAGTLALGSLVDAKQFTPNHYCGKNAMMISFYALQTPDGKQVPINGQVLGGANHWRYVSVLPLQPNCCLESNKATITKNTISFGPGSTTTTTVSTHMCGPTAQSGTIVGAWLGDKEGDVLDQMRPVDYVYNDANKYDRMIISRDTGLVMPLGAPMMLRLSNTSSLAVNSAVPAAGIQLSSIGIGM